MQFNGIAHARRRGFTFVELSIGIGITALVMTALATLTYAVSVQWKSIETAQSLSVMSTHSQARIEQIVRQAKLTGLVRTGGSISSQSATPAAVMFWREDTNGDKAMQFSEMGLLQYDPSADAVLLYTVQWPTSWTPAARTAADVIMSSSDLTAGSAPESFKSLSHVSPTTLVKHVSAASFAVAGASSSTERPKLDVVLQFTVGSAQKLRYFSVAIRCPNKSPSSTGV